MRRSHPALPNAGLVTPKSLTDAVSRLLENPERVGLMHCLAVCADRPDFLEGVDAKDLHANGFS